MGRLHEALKGDGYTGHHLERLLVRLLFILFADHTGIFQTKNQFLVLLEQRTAADGRDLGRWLNDLFQVLDTPEDQRQASLDADLAAFPYVNGRLFTESIRTASFDNAMRDTLLEAAAFRWDEVSPAIFGSLFESVIDDVTQRQRGAHYTPEECILRVIGPLFLDDLRAEFDRAGARVTGRETALRALHDRMAKLRFLDPACGAGNFLVVAYRELRELERELIKELQGKQTFALDVALLSRLNVDHFFGVEIDEFPALIAETALWMTDHIANTRLAEDYGKPYARIPLVASPGIRHADALETDWNSVLAAGECTHVLGNPPFRGAKYQSEAQRAQVRALARLGGSGGTLDYVAAWFLKAGAYAQEGEGVRIGFVATNSICQGEQVAQLWPLLFQRYNLEIAFAHRTFAWPGSAAVHCVIVGLSPRGSEPAVKRLFSYADIKKPPTESNPAAITAYLFGAAVEDRQVVVESVSSPINGAPPVVIGSKPIDGGYLILGPNDRSTLLAAEPSAAQFLKPFVGAEEFLNGGHRWILALQDASPAELRSMPMVMERVRRVRAYRNGTIAASGKTIAKLKVPGISSKALADTPTAFHVTVKPDSPFLVIPEVTSERRDYVPIAWLEPPTIPSNRVKVLLDADPWIFGVLTSRMHMSWMRHICGRLESRYLYSIGIVYNTFPWPDATPAQTAKIETLAQAVLDARALPKNAASTLADLYDPDTMPAELRRAHRDLDLAVDKLYRDKPFDSDQARVEHLFTRYRALVEPTSAAAALNRKQVRKVARRRSPLSP